MDRCPTVELKSEHSGTRLIGQLGTGLHTVSFHSITET